MKTDDDYDKERELEEKKEGKRQKKEANGEVVDGEIEATLVVDTPPYLRTKMNQILIRGTQELLNANLGVYVSVFVHV
jgi:hypothetical protein